MLRPLMKKHCCKRGDEVRFSLILTFNRRVIYRIMDSVGKCRVRFTARGIKGLWQVDVKCFIKETEVVCRGGRFEPSTICFSDKS